MKCLIRAAPAAVVEVHIEPAAGGFESAEHQRPGQCARALPVRCPRSQARSAFSNIQ